MINIEFENFFHTKTKDSLNLQTIRDDNDEKFKITLSSIAIKDKATPSQTVSSNSNIEVSDSIYNVPVLYNQDLEINQSNFNTTPFKLINSIQKKTIEKLEDLNVSFTFIDLDDALSTQNDVTSGKYLTIKNQPNDNLKIESPKNISETPYNVEDNNSLVPLFITKISSILSPIILSTSVLIISGKLNTKLSSFIENHAKKINLQLYKQKNKSNSLEHIKSDNINELNVSSNVNIKDILLLPKTFIAQIKITKEIKNLQNIPLNLTNTKVVTDISKKSNTIGLTFSKSNLEDKKLNLLKNKLKIALNSINPVITQKTNKIEKKDNLNKLVLNNTVGKITSSVQKSANLFVDNSPNKISNTNNQLSESLANQQPVINDDKKTVLGETLKSLKYYLSYNNLELGSKNVDIKDLIQQIIPPNISKKDLSNVNSDSNNITKDENNNISVADTSLTNEYFDITTTISDTHVKNILNILSGFQIKSILTEKEDEKPKTKITTNISYKKDITKITQTLPNSTDNDSNKFSPELDKSITSQFITNNVKSNLTNIVPLLNIQAKNILSILSGFQIKSILTEQEDEKPKTKITTNISYKKDITKTTQTLPNQTNNDSNDFSPELDDSFTSQPLDNKNIDVITPKITNLELVNAPNKNLSLNNKQILHETLKTLKNYIKDNNINIDLANQAPITFIKSDKNVVSFNNMPHPNKTKNKFSEKLYDLDSKTSESSLNENSVKQNNDIREDLAIEQQQKNPEIILNDNEVLLENKSQVLNISSNLDSPIKENDLSNDDKSSQKSPLIIDDSVKNIDLSDLKKTNQINTFDNDKVAKLLETKFVSQVNNKDVDSPTILEGMSIKSLSYTDNLSNSLSMNEATTNLNVDLGSKLDIKLQVNNNLNPKIENKNIIKNSTDIYDINKPEPSKEFEHGIVNYLEIPKLNDNQNILVLNEKFSLLKNYLKSNNLFIDFNTGKILASGQKFSPISIQDNKGKNIENLSKEDSHILFNSKIKSLNKNSVIQIDNSLNEDISLDQSSEQINDKFLDKKIVTNNFVRKDVPLNNLKVKTNVSNVVEESVFNESNSNDIVDQELLAPNNFSSESNEQINKNFTLSKQSSPTKKDNREEHYINTIESTVFPITKSFSSLKPIFMTNNVVSKTNENIIVNPDLDIKINPNIIQADKKIDASVINKKHYLINKEEKVFIFNETLRALNSYLKSNNIEIDSINPLQINYDKEPQISLNTKTNVIENDSNTSFDSTNMNSIENDNNSIEHLATKVESDNDYNLSDTALNPDEKVESNPLITAYISIINESILNKETKKPEPKILPALINNTIGQIDYVLVDAKNNKKPKEFVELETIFKSSYKSNDVEQPKQNIKIIQQNNAVFSSIMSPLINTDKNAFKAINKNNSENKKLYDIFKEFINSEFPEVEIIENSLEKKYFSNDIKFVKNELFSSKNEKLEKFINNISENSSGELIEEKDEREIKNTNPLLSSSQIIKAINDGVAIHFSQITGVIQELASNPAKVDKNIVMNITLKPENLGDISLTCTLTEGNKMSVIFETSTSAAQKVIESYVKNIKDIIKDNSLIVHEVSSSYSAPSSSKPITPKERGSSNNGTNNSSSSESTKNYNQRRKRRKDDDGSNESSLSI